MISIRFLPCLLLFIVNAANAQTKGPWNNHQCAIVLTYDDAINQHLDIAVPALDSLQLKATFFLTCSSPAFTKRIAEWKRVSEKGQELGNHTLFHPCEGGRPGRDWVSPDYDLRTYSIRRMQDELRMTNTVLQTLDGKQQRTFAYPCGDLRVHDSLYLDPTIFVAARGVEDQLIDPTEKNIFNLGSFGANKHSGGELIAEVKKAMASHKALVFLFHGVGGGHPLNVSKEAHSQLLHYLKEHQKEIWNPTFMEMAEWIKGK